jgi:hypothetical protein
VYVPEEWQRQARAAATRNTILQILIGLVFGGLVVGAAVTGVIAWSRRQYSPRLFLAGAVLMLAVTIARAANNGPVVLASLITAAPLPLQIAGLIGVGLVSLTITAVLVGLALGAVPNQLSSSHLLDADVLRLGLAAGLFGAALSAATSWLRTPAWAQTPDIAPFGTLVPLLQVAIDPVPGLLTRTAVILATLAAIDRITSGWTRRRALAAAALALIGFLSAGVPAGSRLGGWMAGGLVMAAGLPAIYVTLLRFDPTMVPIVLGTMAAVAALMRGAERPFPGALAGSLVAVLMVALVALSLWRALRPVADAAKSPVRGATTEDTEDTES